jgi:predicted nucleic acid-binding protein
MILVIDASILACELLQKRGRQLLGIPSLEFHATARVLNETEYELRQRIESLATRNPFNSQQAEALLGDGLETLTSSVTLHAKNSISHLETLARERIPRDPDKWETVALAMILDAAIWTQDTDFLGCGIPTWTTDTLALYLRQFAAVN